MNLEDKNKFTLKEQDVCEEVSYQQLKDLLKDLDASLDKEKEFKFTIRNQLCLIPLEPFSHGKAKIGYKNKNGKIEFQVKFKSKKIKNKVSEIDFDQHG